ncbi:MAG: hypothetical protein ACJAVV_001577 [Alphaproteobacteria bacterium]|jgi:uncharacterized protein
MPNERLQNIDILRGIALLGLPTMNMVVFAMPFAAYLNPSAMPNASWLDHTVFSVFYIFADQKFMGLFTLLFGASLVLLSDKITAKGKKPAVTHYIKTFWLLVFGFLHAWFLWEGDVLMLYAVAALLLYPLKKLALPILLTISVLLLSTSIYFTHHNDISKQTLGIEVRQEFEAIYSPSKTQIKEQSTRLLGDYESAMSSTREQFSTDSETNTAAEIALEQLAISGLLKVFGMMCLGIVLYRLGIIQGQKSDMFYKRLACWGIAFGSVLTCANLAWNYVQHWQIDSYFRYGMIFKDIGAVFITLGYVGLINLLINQKRYLVVKAKIGFVGQMALTNYIMQSLICGLIFYGYGLGWHGSLSRIELLPIVAGIWMFQIGLSYVWLTYFTQGPLEWIWRCLTYFKFLPILH